jgi:hypothetical protein
MVFDVQIALIVAALAFLTATALSIYRQGARNTGRTIALTNATFFGVGALALTIAFLLWPSFP